METRTMTTATDELLKGKDVALLIGCSPETFSRKKPQLIAEEGFPSPLPTGRYWRSAIIRWLDTYGDRKTAALASAQIESIASIRVHDDRLALTAKYVGANAA